MKAHKYPPNNCEGSPAPVGDAIIIRRFLWEPVSPRTDESERDGETGNKSPARKRRSFATLLEECTAIDDCLPLTGIPLQTHRPSSKLDGEAFNHVRCAKRTSFGSVASESSMVGDESNSTDTMLCTDSGLEDQANDGNASSLVSFVEVELPVSAQDGKVAGRQQRRRGSLASLDIAPPKTTVDDKALPRTCHDGKYALKAPNGLRRRIWL